MTLLVWKKSYRQQIKVQILTLLAQKVSILALFTLKSYHYVDAAWEVTGNRNKDTTIYMFNVDVLFQSSSR